MVNILVERWNKLSFSVLLSNNPLPSSSPSNASTELFVNRIRSVFFVLARSRKSLTFQRDSPVKNFYFRIRFSRMPLFQIYDNFADISLTYKTFLVTRCPHESLSDYEKYGWLNFWYTDATFDCKSPEMLRFTSSRDLSWYALWHHKVGFSPFFRWSLI